MKKMISKAVSLLLVLSILTTNNLVWGNEYDQPDKLTQPEIRKVEDNFKLVPPVLESTAVSGSVYENDWSIKLRKINIKSMENSKKRLFKPNQFVYSKKDLEELILSGANEEDIYLSDLLGNEWLTDPHELIDRKRKNNQTWDEIEASLQTEKEKRLEELLQSQTESVQIFKTKNMNTAEKIEILEASTNRNETLEQTLKSYEINGFHRLNAIESLTNENVDVSPSAIPNVNEQSVTVSVYTSTLAITNYSSDINSIYNGLITQMQINQTAKPQYSDGYGTSEAIDSSSGKLVWKETNISLPGRDGLDLNIGVINQSNYSYAHEKNYSVSGNLSKANYLLTRYDLGMGWAFQFPSIQMAEGGYMYYHKGDGAVYRVDFTATNNPDNYTHLIGYQGKDIKLIQDTQGLFNNGLSSSSYYLEYADKKREYFAADGRLLGIVDRFDNAITFQHVDRLTYNDSTKKVISSITDTIGRVITFTYDTTLRDGSFSGEKIKVSVNDMNGIVSQSVTYMKSRVDVITNGNPAGYAPYLSHIQKQDNSLTIFSYANFQKSRFDYNNSIDSGYAGDMTYSPINEVFNTLSSTKYEYEKVTRRLGSNGFGQEIRIISRNNQVKKNYIFSGDINHVNFSYTGDFTGYDPINPYNNPSSFTYSSTQTTQSTSLTGGLAKTSNYNNQGQLTSISTRASNGEKNVVSYVAFDSTYKSMPTAIESRDYGNDTDITPNVLYSSKLYTDWGGVQSETAPLTKEQYDNTTTKINYTTSYTYDPTYYSLKTISGYQNNNILQTEQYDYYSNGRIKSHTNPKGEVTNYCYDAVDSYGGQTSNCTDASVNIIGKVTKIKTTKSLGNGQTSINETMFNTTTAYAYPSETKNYFTSKNSSGETITQVVQNTMNYDMRSGRLNSETDGNGQVTSYLYDALGRNTLIKYPSFTNANGVGYDVSDEISYTNTVVPSSANAENATVSSLLVSSKRKYIQKSNNATTLLSIQNDYYDGFGFMRYSQQSNNGVTQNKQYLPDDLNRAVYTVDPMNNTTTVVYDAWGRQKEALDTYGNLYVTENNIKLRRGTNYFVAAADISAYRDSQVLNKNSLKSSYVEQDYDHWGRLLVRRVYKDWPNQSIPLTELFAYDFIGNLITYTDPNKNLNNDGVTEKYSYDVLNQLSEIKDALGQIVKYSYNKSGQITNTNLQSNESGSMKAISDKAYNELGGLISKKDPSLNQESYDFNNLGMLMQSSDRNGTKFSYQYDEQKRPTLVTATTGTISQQNKLIVGSNGILYDTQELYKNGVKTSSYTSQMDLLKRISSIQVQGLNNTFTSSLGIQYDLNNRTTQYNIAGGASTSFYTQFKYNRLRLDKVQTNGQLAINNSNAVNVNYTYYPNGQLESITYPTLTDGSVLKTEYVYDNLKRLSSISNKKGSALLSSYSYTYDNNGNIVTDTQSLINQTTMATTTKIITYTYDKLDRLLTITSSDKTVVYTYDLQGNRLTLIDTSNLLTNSDNMTYEYDLQNNLIKTTKGSQVTTFEYSPDGLRYRKARGTDIKQYRYNANREVISEVNGSNVATANYVRGDRLLVKKDVPSNKDYYYLYNGHGDVIQMIDTSGIIVNSYEYDEWGNITKQTEQVTNSFKYAGEIYDEESGLYYLRARYYDPSIGRFINEDTYEGQLDNPLSFNLYTYVQNNPLLYTDPSGMCIAGKDAGCYVDSFSGVDNLINDPGLANNSRLWWDYQGQKANCKNSACVSSLAAKQKKVEKANDEIRNSACFYVDCFAGEAKFVGTGTIQFTANGQTSNYAVTPGGLFECNCFTAGTTVLTDKGEKPIEDIQIGDQVLAKNEKTGEVSYQEVEILFRKTVEETYNITVNGEVITTTAEHPFWIVGKGWVKAKDLLTGEQLVTNDNTQLDIQDIIVKKEHRTVYNFRVKKDHTYFVSNLKVWTHNQDSCGSLLSGTASYQVYYGYNSKGTIVYVGITNNFSRRRAEHGGRFDDIRVAYGGEFFTKWQARGLEQYNIDDYGMQKNGGQLENKVNSIAVYRGNIRAITRSWAEKFVNRIK